jgi:type II secretory pathway component PulC
MLCLFEELIKRQWPKIMGDVMAKINNLQLMAAVMHRRFSHIGAQESASFTLSQAGKGKTANEMEMRENKR